ncbi:DUF6527 family protein [Dyella amyloliquefaciens]|uniref:DUF6527 family protein n=1 Tax=Dyella amyloliquefaciens TaxID=1770545 RepID=UPI0013EE5723|nr:DUF6527 family protein [Dyella amyloliquefaciens]
MTKAKIVTDGEGRFYGVQVLCPGCLWPDGRPSAHLLQTDWVAPGMERSTHARPDLWTFNGDLDRPTFAPSLLCKSHRWDGEKQVPYVCHTFIREGRIQFLDDCTHALAGQTVDLPEIAE